MARKIVIEFLGDSKDLQRAMDDADGSTGRLSKTLGSVGKVAALGLGAIVAGAGAVMASGAKLEQQYSKTMSLVGAATGAAGETMKELDALAMQMGAETAFSANEAADAMLELAKAGVTTKDIMGGGLKNTLLLATAGGTDLATAATIASNAMNTFNLKGKDMASVASALAGGANASSASVESLGQGLQQVGPGATNAGMSLHETVAALSAFDAAGIKGADAGTSLKTMLTSLVPATAKAKDYMDRYGLSFTNADGSMKSMTEVAEELKTGLGGLSDVQRTQAMRAIFGSDATRAATVLMKEGEKGIQGYIKATKDQGAAQAMADAAMSGSAGAMERLRGSVETLQLQIGKALAPVLIEVANWLSETGIPAFSGFATWLGENVPVAFEKLKAVVQIVMTALGGDVGSGLGRVQQIFEDVTTIVTSLWDSFGSTIVDYAVKAFANVQQIIGGALTVVQGIFQTFAALLQGDWGKAWDGVRKILSGAWEIIKGIVKQGLNLVGTLLEMGWTAAKGIVRLAWDGIKSVVSAGIGKVVDYLQAVPGKFSSALSTLKSTAAELFRDAMDAGKEKVTNIGATIVSWIEGIPGKLTAKLASFKSAGASLIGAVVDGMKNAGGVIEGIASNVWAAVRSLLNSAIDRINSALEFTISLPGPDITVNPTNIPHLAKGGIVKARPGGTLALIGEAGHDEAVVPLSGPHAPRVQQGRAGLAAAAAPIIVQLMLPGGRVIEQLLIQHSRDTGRPLQVRTLGAT